MRVTSPTRRTASRIGSIDAPPSPNAISSTGTPSAPPAAAAASAFRTAWRPGRWSRTSLSPAGVWRRNALPSPGSMRIALAVTSPARSPNVTTRAGVRRRIASTSASSAFRIATPSAGSPSTRAVFSAARASRPSKKSKWDSPTFVTTPISGRDTATSSRICPGPRIASSTTAISASLGTFARTSGIPISVFQLRGDRTVRNIRPVTAAVSSLVEVFPTLPVMPITRSAWRSRTFRASTCNACSVSGTTIIATSGGTSGTSSVPSTAAAPRRHASAANRCPSVRSPRSATNTMPGETARLSTVTPRTDAAGSPRTTTPPQTAASSRTAISDGGDAGCSRPFAIVTRDLGPPRNSAATTRMRLGSGSAVSRISRVRSEFRAAGAEQVPRDLAVIERNRAVPKNLVRLVALAGDHHDVARPGQRQRAPNRETPVRLALKVPPRGTGLDLADDRPRVLAARIVGGEHGVVGKRRPDASHDRPLRPVAVAAAAEHRHAAARCDLAGEAQHLLESVRRVRVVHDDRKRLPLVHELATAGHAGHGLERAAHNLRRDPARERHRRRRERVGDVEPARKRQHQWHASARPHDGTARSPRAEREPLRAHIRALLDPVGPDAGPAARGHRG